MYPNLKAEMARHNVNVTVLSERTGLAYSTLAPKLRGMGTFTMKEAVLIRDAINKDLTLDYLFSAQPLEAVK
jgi:hypothetical protein